MPTDEVFQARLEDRLQRALNDLDTLKSKVIEMDVKGEQLTKERFRRMEDAIQIIRDDILELKTDIKAKATQATVDEIKQDAKDNRRVNRSALIASSLSFVSSILVGIILYVLLGGR